MSAYKCGNCGTKTEMTNWKPEEIETADGDATVEVIVDYGFCSGCGMQVKKINWGRSGLGNVPAAKQAVMEVMVENADKIPGILAKMRRSEPVL